MSYVSIFVKKNDDKKVICDIFISEERIGSAVYKTSIANPKSKFGPQLQHIEKEYLKTGDEKSQRTRVTSVVICYTFSDFIAHPQLRFATHTGVKLAPHEV